MGRALHCEECKTPIPDVELGACPTCLLHEALGLAASDVSAGDPLIGAAVSGYEILERIGEGGMGRVFKARHQRLGRTVAIKVLPPGSAAERKRRERFLREARSVSSLNHPHIVTVHDLVSAGDRDALVMEYVEGRTLAEILSSGPLGLEEVFRYGGQVAGALAAAHQAGIVHRDVKPSNVIVDEGGVAKLLDFGIAKPMPGDGEGPLTQLTRDGALLGTAPYMSPEQVEGKPVDSRTDVFSLGALLYEMATGKPPFIGDSAAAVVAAILRETPRAPSRLRPELPASFDALVAGCVEKQADDRTRSADEVQSRLEGMTSRRPGTVSRRALARGLGWLIAALALSLAAWWWLGRPAPPEVADEGAEATLKAEAPDGPSIEELSTDNLEAYVEYLRGIREMRSYTSEDRMVRAEEHLQRAVELDPGFGEAWGRLVGYRSMALANGRYPRERRDEIVASIEKAMARAEELAPDAVATRLGLGYYHRYITRDVERAYVELERVAALEPDDLEVVKAMGAVQRRRGDYDDSLRHFRRALEIAPADPETVGALLQTCMAVRDADCAASLSDKAIISDPSQPFLFQVRAKIEMKGRGSLETARKFLDQSPDGDRALPELAFYERDFEQYLRAFKELKPAGRGADLGVWHLRVGIGERRTGNEAAAVSHFEEVLAISEEMFLGAAGHADRAPILRGLALAYLGRSAEAVSMARSLPNVLGQGDRFVGPYVGELEAEILTAAGATDEAIDQIERMLATHYADALTLWDLRLDPTWDPLRQHPRFQALIGSDRGEIDG